MALRTKRFGLIAWCVLEIGLARFACSQESSAELTFKLAPGLSIQKIAAEPLVHWPMLGDWDSEGRLVVVQSGGVGKPIEEHNKLGLHQIVRLIDDNGDGVFDRRILAADNLPFTEGVLCLGNTILATAPPVIWRLTDEDGDGLCEHREVWFDGQTITGCANDLHGPYLGRDGWVYWTKGAFAEQTHQLANGKTLKDKAAHIYRRRLTGGPIEPVMNGGMDNPVGFAVLPNGERFFSSTFLVHPGDGRRDGVVHAIYGGAYGKDHSALDGIVRTGELMPIMAHLGPAAPSGLKCLNSHALVEGNQPTLVGALFNLQKVIGLPLQEQGASYQTQPFDLVVGSRVDFHPTDVIEDADGSLIVIDTGGWYDLCCPSSRVDQQTASGGIYRLWNTSVKRPTSSTLPAWEQIDAERLLVLLDDPRPWVARSAFIRLSQLKSVQAAPNAIELRLVERIQDTELPIASRQNALWALGAIGSELAMHFATNVIAQRVDSNDDSSDLRHIACQLVGLHRFGPAKEPLEQLVITRAARSNSGSGLLLRAAIEALGRIGDAQSIRVLLQAEVDIQSDRVLDHSLRYALYEISDTKATYADELAAYLKSAKPRECALALGTLDLLKAEQHLTAVRLLQAASEPETASTVFALLEKRPGLAPEVFAKLGPEWKKSMTDLAPPELFQRLVRAWIGVPEMQQWIADSFQQPHTDVSWQWVEMAMQSVTGASSIPEIWHPWIVACLNKEGIRMAEILARVPVHASKNKPVVDRLIKYIDEETDVDRKLKWTLSLPPQHLYSNDAFALQLVDSLKNSPADSAPWQNLRRLKISDEVARQLLALVDQFSPTALQQAIETIASASSDELDQQLLSELSTLQAARGLPRGSLINVYRGRNEPLRRQAQDVSELLEQSDPNFASTIQSLLAELPAGDPVRGLTLFHGSKANCGACHQMGYVGGKIGPELTRLGASRTREALLEAILMPNQRIEQGFQSTQVLTVDGRLFNGIVTGRTGDVVELRISADKIESISIDEIDQMLPSDVSIMPSGMQDVLSRQELADILSLLEAQ